ncbi:GntR family transcriptional regulator [Marimonas lutisalis]|uniref:GntR family transcriptional regulator n=1 Tax=Marimonas lutisalis TaxID=2545756 RepID=UPI0010F64BA1|nr:GntR family transcriptional regulator [Marimonas lutisalis]
MTDTVKNRKAALYDHLKTSILTLALDPGSDLDEADLSTSFGLSRTPLREVFRELAGEGYLELHAGRGARVSGMSHTTVRDFFLAAPMIYGAILRLAALNASPRQIEELRTAQDRFRTALRTGDAAARALANNRFHEITGEMAGNVYLLPSFYRLLIDHARIGMTFYRPQNNEMAGNLTAASDQHDAIIAAIEARDADAAARLADEHWKLSRDQIEMFVMPAPLDMPLGTFPKNSA